MTHEAACRPTRRRDSRQSPLPEGARVSATFGRRLGIADGFAARYAYTCMFMISLYAATRRLRTASVA